MVQTGPSGLPRFGQSPRRCHGVRIVPMKYTPASAASGKVMATSPGRIALSAKPVRGVLAVWFGSSFIGALCREVRPEVQRANYKAAVTALISV